MVRIKGLLVEIRKDSRIIILIIIFLNFCLLVKAEAELILVEGDVNLLSCTKIYDRFFLLYSNRRENFSEVLLEEFDSNWREIQKRRLDINGASAYLTYFNDRFYVSYTSFEKEGNVRIAEFGRDWNFLRDILVTPTPYDGEIAYQLIPLDDNHLYLFYARNWVNDCGLKMVEFDRYLEALNEFTLIKGDVDFHAHQASEFSIVFANNCFYVAYKKYTHVEKEVIEKRIQELLDGLKKETSRKIRQVEEKIENLQLVKKTILEQNQPSELEKFKLEAIEEEFGRSYSRLEDLRRQADEGLSVKIESEGILIGGLGGYYISTVSADIYVNEYSLSGELIQERCIDRQQVLSPSLFFNDEKFYLAYEDYDDNLMKPIIYICQYDREFNLLKKTRIITQESGAPREKAVIVSEGRCYLVTVSEGRETNTIFLKEIDFDLEEDKVKF